MVIDYVGTVDGEEFEGGAGRDQLLELGSGRLVPGFEEQLVGASAGDERTVTITFPEDYPGTELAGKEAQFAVTVNEVKAKHLPEPDDDFAAEAAGFDTLEPSCARTSQSACEKVDEQSLEREFEDAVIEAAVAEAEVEVPDKLVHARAHELLEDTFSMLARQGISKDAYLRISGRDEETLAHEAEPEAAAALKREAVLAAIVEAEGIEPTDEQVREALEPTAERQGTTVEKLLRAAALERAARPRAPRGRHAPGDRAARGGGQADQRRAGQGPQEALDPRQGGREQRPPARSPPDSSGLPAADPVEEPRSTTPTAPALHSPP